MAKTNCVPWGFRLNYTGGIISSQNRFELKGQVKESTFSLNRINFGARVYNPTIGRWDKVDLIGDKYYSYSSYDYTLNNPINSIDPDGNEVFDWIKNKDTNQFVWDINVTSTANTPENFEYVGRSVSDVQKHFEKNNPVASFFVIKSSFGENRTFYTGEVAQSTLNWIDNWASSGNLLASASYSLADSFSVTLQSLNPFDEGLVSVYRRLATIRTATSPHCSVTAR
jgi:RHS repeat-associated protein